MAKIVKFLAIGIGLSSSIITFIIWYRRKRQVLPDPQKWQLIGYLRELNIFPLKSGSVLQLQEANINEFGLYTKDIQDRQLIVINERDNWSWAFAGAYPYLLSIQPKIIDEKIINLKALNIDSTITIDLNKFLVEKEPSKILEKKGLIIELMEGDAIHHRWISQVVLKRDHGMRLFIIKKIIIKKSPWWQQQKNILMPVMVVHDKSVKDLNERLSEKNQVNHLQFRGNFLVESLDGTAAFDEDNWLWMKIGDDTQMNRTTILRYDSPCQRCILPNIDLKTCKRNAEFEPLRTLRSYRLNGHPKEPDMGIYLTLHKSGLLRVGDPVFVQYK